MNKPPAFQFYPDNFLGGTAHMTTEEVGAYVLLLCYQWNAGHVPPDNASIRRIARLSSVSGIAIVKSKFEECSDGLLRNARMELERRKQIEYRANRSESGKAGASKRWHSDSTAIVLPLAKNSFPSPSPLLRESADRPSLEEVKGKAQMIGLAEWKAVDWYEEMSGCGWLDHAHRPIVDWQSVLSRVRTKWEADGRPMSPPARNGAGGAVKVFPEAKLRQLDEQISRHFCNPQSLIFDKAKLTTEGKCQLAELREQRRTVQNQIATAPTK